VGGIEVRTLSGGKWILDDGRPYEGPISAGDPELQEAVWDHVEEHLGPITAMMHFGAEAVSVDILWVAPSEDRQFHTLVTCGMAERPMNLPLDAPELRHAELVISLPPSWPLLTDGCIPPESRWPFRLIGGTALYAHRAATWLWMGHTLTYPDQEAPFACGTALACAVLSLPRQLPTDFHRLRTGPDRTISFYNAIPIYREELEIAMRSNSISLLRLLIRSGVADVVDARRPNLGTRAEKPEPFVGPPRILPFPRRLS
jgi:hypothetical protein